MNFEEDLQGALRRVDAPAGFAKRVLERVERQQRYQRRQWWVGIAAAVAVALILPVGIERHEQQEKGRRAARELTTALRITGKQLVNAKLMIAERSGR